jgi:hypothetical protein
MAEPPKASAKGGAFITKKAGPLPVWGWIAIAAVGIYLYRKYHGSTSATPAAQSATGSTATGVPTETLTLPSGESYSGPVGYGPPGNNGPTPGNGSTPPNNTLLPGQTVSHGTYTDPSKAPIVEGGYSYVPFASGAAANQFVKGGGTVYSEVGPGVFQPLKKGQNPGNAFVYARQGANG